MRLIVQEPLDAFYNMALDEAVSEAVRERRCPPTLRFYRWDRPSVSLGYFQSTSDINIDYCSLKGYPIVRRMTGGRAILHDSELTYSVSSSSIFPLFKKSLLDTYYFISDALLCGLKSINIKAKVSRKKRPGADGRNPACFKATSYGEITIDGKKIIGSAQKRFKDGFLQHGSILVDFDAQELLKVLKCSGDDLSEVGALRDYSSDILLDDLISSLKHAFEKELNIKLISDSPTKFEKDLAKRLEREKYSSREWNYRR